MLWENLKKLGLSSREAEVVEWVSKGLRNKEVASELFVTEKTVKFHLTNIYKKMKIKSRSQLIVWCAPHIDFVEIEKAKNAPKPASPGEQWEMPAGITKVGNA